MDRCGMDGGQVRGRRWREFELDGDTAEEKGTEGKRLRGMNVELEEERRRNGGEEGWRSDEMLSLTCFVTDGEKRGRRR